MSHPVTFAVTLGNCVTTGWICQVMVLKSPASFWREGLAKSLYFPWKRLRKWHLTTFCNNRSSIAFSVSELQPSKNTILKIYLLLTKNHGHWSDLCGLNQSSSTPKSGALIDAQVTIFVDGNTLIVGNVQTVSLSSAMSTIWRFSLCLYVNSEGVLFYPALPSYVSAHSVTGCDNSEGKVSCIKLWPCHLVMCLTTSCLPACLLPIQSAHSICHLMYQTGTQWEWQCHTKNKTGTQCDTV